MILDEIVEHTRQEVAAAKRQRPLSSLIDRLAEAPPHRDYASALSGDGIRIIAEIKRASPSKGILRTAADPSVLATCFAAAGASAISVLTDRRFFGGSLEDLEQVSRVSPVPTLRKDFVIDPYQVYEAALAGASSALLIVGILDDAELTDLLQLQRELGMEPQVEVHDEREVERALAVGARILGINNRDLRSFRVDLGTSERLRPLIPSDCIVVSESGIHTRSDVERLAAAGIRVIHVGEALMTSADPGDKIRELLGQEHRR
ncbi:MAG TPA: indole-3-glycerol phosphate synthase TrpC [Chloroflexota bacterium]|nr:indole-3-glycerol phosphate synthase TrpC [Chloroflexota bacterium]